ncbi:hypothetical protein DUNSADRAFT_7772 [Dunaliella salina]|uniref:Encoded protein n=1 Tax=Dunaliella salina TaxID=3046 RepID=A0ABQ7GKP1_DUNSA|nr:hypothetical protein DUNSADRAFT_7772 [Dunaliella salina]|eukprot:KAF5835182.1 hypothetical protein DUNSADRAFT_7772 [Dunaliella salina]
MGSKTIRYRRSLNHKRCRLGIGRCFFLGSGGSMVARLKLKGIDGRAPPGVNLRNGYHIQGRQQARKLPNPNTGR